MKSRVVFALQRGKGVSAEKARKERGHLHLAPGKQNVSSGQGTYIVFLPFFSSPAQATIIGGIRCRKDRGDAETMIPLGLIHLQELVDIALGLLSLRSASGEGEETTTGSTSTTINTSTTTTSATPAPSTIPSITDASDPRGDPGQALLTQHTNTNNTNRPGSCAQPNAHGSKAKGGVPIEDLVVEGAQIHSPSLSMPTDTTATLDPSSSKGVDYTHLRNELLLLREKNATLQSALRDAQQRLATKDVQLDSLRDKNRKLESDLRDLHRVAEERAGEVKSLETFLTKTDRWAGAQIVQTVKDLNTEILQFSAAASETFALERREVQQTPSRQKSVDFVKARHGTALSRCLERRDHSLDPTLLQYALQASISHSLCRALSSFVFGSPSKLDQILMKIYLHMHITGKLFTLAAELRVISSPLYSPRLFNRTASDVRSMEGPHTQSYPRLNTQHRQSVHRRMYRSQRHSPRTCSLRRRFRRSGRTRTESSSKVHDTTAPNRGHCIQNCAGNTGRHYVHGLYPLLRRCLKRIRSKHHAQHI